ncbi:MAG: DUF4384 domain-containing protein [Elusimicrobiota bacterium]
MGSKILRCVSILLLPAMLAAWSPAQAAEPDWLEKTIIPDKEHIYSVGHSRPQQDERAARDEAMAEATREFVRYCKTDIDSLNRIYEAYSSAEGKVSEKTDIESSSQIRIKAVVKGAIAENWYVRRKKNRYQASVLLKIPKEEYERISAEKNIKLSVDIGFYYEDADKKMQALSDGSVLKSGDGYAVYLKPSDTSFIYIYQVDALNKSYRLFPNADFNTAANPVAAGTALWVPSNEEVLFLDDTTGKEYFYILAAPNKIAEFEGERAVSLARKDLDSAIGFKKMGVAGVRKKLDSRKIKPPAKTDVVEVKKKLQAEGAFVYETWFWHK